MNAAKDSVASEGRGEKDRPLVLLTRPQAASDALVAAVEERGWRGLVAPAMTIEPRPAPLPDLDSYDGLVFTSANGVRSFTALSDRRDHRVFAVGKATAETACAAGFADIVVGGGDAESLMAALAQRPELQGRRLLHLAGVHTARTLEVPGIGIDQLPLYEAVAAGSLPQQALEALDQRVVKAVMFFSPRTARIFVDLLARHARTQSASTIKALCIADSVVKSLEDISWKDVHVARAPDKDAMLDLLAVAL